MAGQVRRAGRLRALLVAIGMLSTCAGTTAWHASHAVLPLYDVQVPVDAAKLGWLDEGSVPGEGTPYGPVSEKALLDLRGLTVDGEPGAVLAAGTGAWRFVWPRDAAFVAVAYARTGHGDDAREVLGFLQRHQRDDGSMSARYLPTGGAPDGRPAQEDGPGWALWAVREVVDAEPDAAARQTTLRTLTPLVVRSTNRLLDRLDPGTGLPAPSPDYWEVEEDALTLGIAATSLMGLEAATALAGEGVLTELDWNAAGVDPGQLPRLTSALRGRVVQEFGPDFARHPGGLVDAAGAFLLPPYLGCVVPGADQARRDAVLAMTRPAGGVAPGAGWRSDGVTWTPETGLQAVAAAGGGYDEEARRWLDWLGAHRTPPGSFPEKVLYDGRPAAVAPLAWTSALWLIAVDELGRTAEVDCPAP